jgi:hypothetical protein
VDAAMFESRERLFEEIGGLLEAIRALARSRYACLFDPERLLLESAEDEEGHWVLRHYLEQRRQALFRIPAAMAEGTELEDVFSEWESRPGESPDEFLLAFVNRKILLVIACSDAERLQGQVLKPLRALADRLFRLNPAWRLDEKGRGLFLTRPKLDLVVVGRPQA